MSSDSAAGTIETKRLILRESGSEADSNPAFRLKVNDANGFLGTGAASDAEGDKTHLTARYGAIDPASIYLWSAELKNCGEVIGSVGIFSICRKNSRASAEIRFLRKFAEDGYAAEATKAVIQYMIYSAGIGRIEACISPDNAACAAVLRKSGMEKEECSRQGSCSAENICGRDIYAAVKSRMYTPSEFAGFYDIKLADGQFGLECVKKTVAVPEKKWVPAYFFDIKQNGEKIGTIDLRIGMTESLYYGGHIGYGVIEAFRGKGYAAKACELLKPLIRLHGFKSILITNNITNRSSQRVCEKLGAELVRIAELPVWHDLYKEGARKECIWEWETQ